MGHSEAWRDAEWLAAQILRWIFAEERPFEISHFTLLGSRIDVAALVNPVNGGKEDRSLNFTLTAPSGNVSIDEVIDANSLLRTALHTDRYLCVRPGITGGKRLQKPRTLQRATRKMIAAARTLKPEEPCPTIAQHLPLVIAKQTTVEDLTLQIIIVLSQWGLIEITQSDHQAFVTYVSNLFLNPSRSVVAAEEAIPFIFTNWVFPEDWRAFKAYARRTVWGLSAQVARNSAKMRHGSNSAFGSLEDWAEQEQEKRKRGKKSAETARKYISVSELADISGVSPQRIYEMIKAKKLKAAKIGMSLRVEASVAEQFYKEANRRRGVKNFKSQLLADGMTKEALRKRIYRHRMKHGTEGDILTHLDVILQDRLKKIPLVSELRNGLRSS